MNCGQAARLARPAARDRNAGALLLKTLPQPTSCPWIVARLRGCRDGRMLMLALITTCAIA